MLDPDRVRSLVRAALDEDLGRGDLTTEVTVPDSEVKEPELRLAVYDVPLTMVSTTSDPVPSSLTAAS